MADNRFIPWFKIEFEPLPAAGGGGGGAGAAIGAAAGAASAAAGTAGGALAALTGVVPVSRDFFEADVKIEMHYAPGGNTFEAIIAGLGSAQYEAIKVNETVAKISLGYYGGDQKLVFEGVVQSKQARQGDCFYETELRGVEKAHFLLERKCFEEGEIPYEEDRDLLDILEAIRDGAGVPLETPGAARGDDTRLARRRSFERQSALEALRWVHERTRQIDGYSLFLRDGKMRYSKKEGSNNNTGETRAVAYSHENYLLQASQLHVDQGGPARACQARPGGVGGGNGASALGAAAGAALGAAVGAVGGAVGAIAGAALSALGQGGSAPGLGYQFTILGHPDLRPGDTITFRLKENEVERERRLTIESITHDFSRANGYRCTGRALDADTFLTSVFTARAPGLAALSEAVDDQRQRNQERNPAVHVGDITSYDPEHQLVDARLGLRAGPTMTSPSVQVELGTQGFHLRRRPIASPFAWNLCGLVVPIYPGMRGVGLHNRYLREDALLHGFVWTEQMEPPPAQAGDYWLCLPLNASNERPPNESNQGANDLITGDGKRVIQLRGLKIQIGQALLPNLGARPDPGGDDELLIEFGPNTHLKMTADQIEMKAGGITMTIGGGKVSVSSGV